MSKPKAIHCQEMVYHTDGNLDTLVTKQIVSFSYIYWWNTRINVDPAAGLNSRYILQWCIIRRISITEILHFNETDMHRFWSHISKSWLYVCFMYYSHVRDIGIGYRFTGPILIIRIRNMGQTAFLMQVRIIAIYISNSCKTFVHCQDKTSVTLLTIDVD